MRSPHRMLVYRVVAALAAVCIATSAQAAAGTSEPQPLPAAGAKIDETSVSGISAGAYMAGQFGFAHGKIVTGVAIIAGGPYGCAQSPYANFIPGPGAAYLNLSKAINGCMLNALQPWGIPNPEQLAANARDLAEKGRIDPIDSVKSDRIYLFSGKSDRTVVPAIVAAARKFYADLGVPAASVKSVTRIDAGHAFVTENEGLACSITESPYVVDCNYDQAGDLLAHIYRSLRRKTARARATLLAFDQRPYTTDMSSHGLAQFGFVYIPKACTESACRIHVAFHGCGQNEASAGNSFTLKSGFLPWADNNRLIILFPQVAPTATNPQACWDWWGYTGHDFLTRDAAQIVAVYRMLERLATPRSSTAETTQKK